LLVFWYTYRPDGTSTFLVGTATINGLNEYTGTLQITEGMQFGSFNPNTLTRTNWGTMTIEILDCNTAVFSWTSSVTGYADGSIDIQRLTRTSEFACIDDSVSGNYAITYLDEDDRYEGTALFLPTGEVYFATGESDLEDIGVGIWRKTARLNVSLEGTIYEREDGVLSPPLSNEPFTSASIININGLAGGALSAVPQGQLRATRLRDFSRNVTVASIAGTYTMIDLTLGGFSGTVTIASDGAVTGTAINGCNLGGGRFEQTAAGTNQFAIGILVSDSDPLCNDSDLVGAGYLVDDEDVFHPNSIFMILVNDDTEYASIFRLTP
jgi:hypothetical protein